MSESLLESAGKSPRSRAWLWLGLLALAAGGGYYAYQRYQPASEPSPLAVPGGPGPESKGGRPGGAVRDSRRSRAAQRGDLMCT